MVFCLVVCEVPEARLLVNDNISSLTEGREPCSSGYG